MRETFPIVCRLLPALVPVVLATGAAPAREPGGSFDPRGGEQAWSLAMHVHGSFSEGMGSMEWHSEQAAALGVDAVWWTDHDWRVEHWRHTRRFDFEAATWDPDNRRIVEPDDAYPFQYRRWDVGAQPFASVVDTLALEGLRSMRLEYEDVWNWPQFLSASLTQVSSRFHNMYHLGARVRLHFAVFPEQLDAVDARIVLEVRLSEHPNEWHELRYVIGSMSGEGPHSIALPYQVGQWNVYDVNVTEDAIQHFTTGGADTLRAEDNSMYEVSIEMLARNGARTVAFVDDYRIDTDEPSGAEMMDKTREIAAHYAAIWPGLQHFVGTEVSRYKAQPHLNGFGPNLQLVDYTGYDWPDSIFYAVDQLQAQGAVVSLDHAYGVGFGVYGVPQTPEEIAERIQYTKRGMIRSRAYGCDLFEAGYRIRNGIELADYIDTWDTLTGNAVFVTGNGITDTHGGTFLNGWGPWQPGNENFENNFVTWAWAPELSEAALMDPLRGGRVFFGDPWAWDIDGTMDLVTTDGFRMGSIVVTDRASHDLIIQITDVPPDVEVRLRQGEIREDPPAEYLDVSFLRDELLSGTVVGSVFADTVTIDTTIPAFVRIEAGTGGDVWAFSNPVHFVDSVPQTGVPGPRVAASLGDVRIRSATDFLLTDVSFTETPTFLIINGDEETPGLATMEIDCGPLGPPASVVGGGTTSWWFDAGILTLVGFTGAGSEAVIHWGAVDAGVTAPTIREVALGAGAPNPFGTGTVSELALPSAAHVFVEILDVTGRRVRVLVDERRPAGRHRIEWDGRDHGGREVGNGVYFLRLTTSGERITRKAVKVR